MLPPPNDLDFPEKLREAREARGLSRSELAHLAGISEVMPGRYETRSRKLFARPGTHTWQMLNAVLFPETCAQPDPSGAPTRVIHIGPAALATPRLNDATLDELIAELKRRGATAVQLTFGNPGDPK